MDLNLKCKAVNYLEKKQENVLGLVKQFLDLTLKTWQYCVKTDKLDFIKTKNIYFLNDNVKRIKR